MSTQRSKTQPVNSVNAEIPSTEYVTRAEFTAMMASMCTQVGITLGEVKGAALVIEQTVNEAKRMKEKENKEKMFKGFSLDTTNGSDQRSNVKLG